jgi:hypothetical protein
MDEQTRQYHILRARAVLRDIHHIPVASVNKDGSPHTSPVLLVFNASLCGYWASSPDSLHSQNIARDPRVFLSIFNSREGHSGLFLAGTATELTERQAIATALDRRRLLKEELYGGDMGDVASYTGMGTQRIYEFTPEHAWVNHSEKQGCIIVHDQRYEITVGELPAS